MDYSAAEATPKVAPGAEKEQDVDIPAEEPPSPLLTHPEGEQGQDKVKDTVSDISEQSPKNKPSGEKENTLREEEKAVCKEDEMDEDGDEKNLNEPTGFSVVLRRPRKKAAPPRSRRTSKRLRKKALEKEEKGSGRTMGGNSGRGRKRNEHGERKGNKRKAGRDRAQLRRGRARKDAAVTHKMVLRRKTKLIQPTRRTRSMRQGKM